MATHLCVQFFHTVRTVFGRQQVHSRMCRTRYRLTYGIHRVNDNTYMYPAYFAYARHALHHSNELDHWTLSATQRPVRHTRTAHTKHIQLQYPMPFITTRRRLFAIPTRSVCLAYMCTCVRRLHSVVRLPEPHSPAPPSANLTAQVAQLVVYSLRTLAYYSK